MRKLLLIATLSLGTLALAHTMPSNMGTDHDFYNQTVAAQAEHNSLFLGARELSSPGDSESWINQEHPSSIASNAESQSAGADYYDRTIAVQANVNRIIQAASRF